MFYIMLDLTSEALLKQRRKLLQDALKRCDGGGTYTLETTRPGGSRKNGTEMAARNGLTGETAMFEIDE